jgi:hypothetical protein
MKTQLTGTSRSLFFGVCSDEAPCDIVTKTHTEAHGNKSNDIAQTAFRDHDSVMQLHHFHIHALQPTQVMQHNWLSTKGYHNKAARLINCIFYYKTNNEAHSNKSNGIAQTAFRDYNSALQLHHLHMHAHQQTQAMQHHG